eukprot:6994470-Prymnesium_polylepis.1
MCLHLEVLLLRLGGDAVAMLQPRGRGARRARAARRPRRATGRTRSARAPRGPPIWRRPAQSGPPPSSVLRGVQAQTL